MPPMCHVLGYKFATQQNKYLCPCEADILATHSSHLSQCIGTKPPLGRRMGPPSLVTPTLLPFRIYCHFLFCPGSQLAGLMPIVYLLVFSPQWDRILRAALVSSGVSKQNTQRQTFSLLLVSAATLSPFSLSLT